MRRWGAALAALIALAGCGPDAAEPQPHGYVAGAEETAEPQHRLVLADDSAVYVLDLITEDVTEVARLGGITGVEGDGRFAYVAHGAGALRVVDSGAWTVDHGDHVHYYRAAPRDLGSVDGRRVLSGDGVVAVSGDGGTRLLDRARLEKGEVAWLGSVPYESALPFRDRLYVPVDGGIEVLTREGSPAGRAGECREPRGAAVTGRGAVFTCSSGALLIGRDDVRTIHPEPEWGPAGRAGGLHGRPGSSVLAGPARNGGVWVLDADAGEWRFLDTGPVTAVAAAGPEEPVLVLTPDGVLRGWDYASGRQVSERRLLTRPDERAVIQADQARAYVSDPAGRAVHEIDYRDGLRRARTFPLGFTPAHLVETGR